MISRFDHRTTRWMRTTAIATLALATTLLASMGTASATDACGEYSYGFAGTRLLNDGISTSAGPFGIDLPAGVYDVTLVSHDDHLSGAFHGDQPAEQWYVVLDAWTSPLSHDLPDDRDWITTTHSSQSIPASTSISVRHRGEGTVNSIDVVCVGFTPVAGAVDESVTDSDDATATDDASGDDAGSDEPTDDSTPTEEPPADDPTTDANEPATEDPANGDPAGGDTADEQPTSDTPAQPTTEASEEDIEVEVKGAVEEAPIQEIAEPAAIVAGPDAPAETVKAVEVVAGPTATVTPAAVVAQAQPVDDAQLALTGRSDTLWLLALGVALLGFGAALVRREHATA